MTPYDLIDRGLAVFPLSPNSKKPWPGLSWPATTVTTRDQLDAVIGKYPDCGWAVNTGASGLCVVDIDRKEFDGLEGWKKFESEQGAQEPTFTVKTPSGGYHLYYRGDVRNSASKLAKGVDVRGDGGYVVAPGVTTSAGLYEIVNEAQIAEASVELIEVAGAAREKTEREPDINSVDDDSLISAAVQLLQRAEGAIKDSGTGNHDTFVLACRVKDCGVSQVTCLELMAEHWADKCSPPYDPQDLQRVIKNAYEYAETCVGSATAEAAFRNEDNILTYAEQLKGSEAEKLIPLNSEDEFHDAVDIDESMIPARQWLLGKRYIKGFATQIVAPGGVGKSMLSIIDALSLASGVELTEDHVKEPGPVWLHNAEDPIDELKMRVAASVKHHGVELQRGKLILTSGRTTKIRLVSQLEGAAKMDLPTIQRVKEFITNHGIKLFIADPLIRLHNVQENSNEQMDVVMEALQEIAEETGCAICIVHHTRKLNGASGAGDMDTGRGASSVVSAARLQFTLTTMSEKEAEAYGVDEEKRRWYVQLADSKANMAPPLDHRVWLEKKSVELLNGESVGTFERVHLKQVTKEDPKNAEMQFAFERIADIFCDGTVRSVREVAEVIAADPDWQTLHGATKETLANRFASKNIDVIVDDKFVIEFVHDQELVPGRSKHGIRCCKIND